MSSEEIVWEPSPADKAVASPDMEKFVLEVLGYNPRDVHEVILSPDSVTVKTINMVPGGFVFREHKHPVTREKAL